MAEQAKTASRKYMVTRRCKTVSGRLLERDTVYELTDAEADALIESEIARLPKKGELAEAK